MSRPRSQKCESTLRTPESRWQDWMRVLAVMLGVVHCGENLGSATVSARQQGRGAPDRARGCRYVGGTTDPDCR